MSTSAVATQRPELGTDRFVCGVPLGRWQTNCFVVGDRSAGRAVVVDPGEGAEDAVPGLLAQRGVTCEAIALTHGHLDHLWGVPQLARTLDVPVLLHPEDRWIWDDPAAAFGAPPELLEQQFGLTWDPPTDHLRDVRDGDDVDLAGITYRVRHNPGHTPGHVTYLGRDLAGVPITFVLGDADVASDEVLFSGDLIFAGSVGRSDFPRGDGDRLLRSLVDTVLPLDDDTLVLAGHGPDTTVGRERAANPFLHEAIVRHG